MIILKIYIYTYIHMTDLSILGAGGHGRVVLESASQLYNHITFFDDKLDDHPIQNSPKDWDCICAIGDNLVRENIVSILPDRNWITIFHPSSIVSETAFIGVGCYIGAGAVIQPHAIVGNHTIINTNAVVEHDCTIGDFCHIGPNATLCGSVQIGQGTLIGAGSVIIPNITISNYVIVGAGSTVISAIEAKSKVVGSPAKRYI